MREPRARELIWKKEELSLSFSLTSIPKSLPDQDGGSAWEPGLVICRLKSVGVEGVEEREARGVWEGMTKGGGVKRMWGCGKIRFIFSLEGAGIHSSFLLDHLFI